MTRTEALDRAEVDRFGSRRAVAYEAAGPLVAWRYEGGSESIGPSELIPSPIRDYRADRLAQIEVLAWTPLDRDGRPMATKEEASNE